MAGARAADPDRICGTDAIPRLVLFDVFKMGRHLKIPLFQRRYCWGKSQLAQFLSDVVKQTGGNGGVPLKDDLADRHPYNSFGVGHSLGRLVVSTATAQTAGDVAILDGQQRLTTSCLLLAALRDIVDTTFKQTKCVNPQPGTHSAISCTLQCNETAPTGEYTTGQLNGIHASESRHIVEAESVIETINFTLFGKARSKRHQRIHSPDEPSAGVDVEGPKIRLPTLLPTYFDRTAFIAAVGANSYDSDSSVEGARDTGDWIFRAKQYFHDLLAKGDFFRVAEKLGQPVPADCSTRHISVLPLPVVVATCSAITRAVLLGCTVLWFDVREEDIFTVYERLAFRDTMLAKFMHNPTPGQDMGESDLSRNFLLSYFAGDETQIAMLHKYWIPIELTLGGASVTDGTRQRVDGMLDRFLCSKDAEAESCTSTEQNPGQHSDSSTDSSGASASGGTDGAVHLGAGMPQLFPTYKRLRAHVEARLRAAHEPIVASHTTRGAAAVAESVLQDLLHFAKVSPNPTEVPSLREDVFARPARSTGRGGRREQPQAQIHVDTTTNKYNTTAPPWKR